MPTLWSAYLNGDERLMPFFAHLPRDWAPVLESCRYANVEPLEPIAVEEIIEANTRWGVAPAVVECAKALGRRETRVIATGQQAGLLGGPLYTLYKAIAAVRWAEHIERTLDTAVVPVFWVVSDDDDFDEVRSFRWLDAQGQWNEYTYQACCHSPGMPIHCIKVEPHLRTDLAQVFASVRQTEFTAQLAKRLDAIASEAADLEEFFIRIIAWLLRDHSPLFVSPRMNWLRERTASVVRQEMAQPGESSRRVIEAGERLRALAFSPQVVRRPQHVNCFLLDGGLRHKILVGEGCLEIISPAGERRKANPDEVRSELASNPARFGVNVVTHPIVHDSALPTIAYVAGPSEVAYFAQLRGVYEMFGVPMPMIVPRPQVCLIEPRLERALSALNLTLESGSAVLSESSTQFDEFTKTHVSEPGAAEHLEEARRRLDEAVEFVKSKVNLSDPAVARSFKKLSGSVKLAFDKLAERQCNSAMARGDKATHAVAVVRDSLWPGGQLQERALTAFFPFLNLFGAGLIECLADAIQLDSKEIQPIVLSEITKHSGTQIRYHNQLSPE